MSRANAKGSKAQSVIVYADENEKEPFTACLSSVWRRKGKPRPRHQRVSEVEAVRWIENLHG
jgi:hypothetical protein